MSYIYLYTVYILKWLSFKLGILSHGLIFALRQFVCAWHEGHACQPLHCGSGKHCLQGQLRGCCLSSQAENGPCPFLPCSVSFSSCLSFVMDTACNEKSQHIYEVSDLTGAQGFNPAGSKHTQTYVVEKRLGMLQVHSVKKTWKIF